MQNHSHLGIFGTERVIDIILITRAQMPFFKINRFMSPSKTVVQKENKLWWYLVMMERITQAALRCTAYKNATRLSVYWIPCYRKVVFSTGLTTCNCLNVSVTSFTAWHAVSTLFLMLSTVNFPLMQYCPQVYARKVWSLAPHRAIYQSWRLDRRCHQVSGVGCLEHAS